MTEAAPSEGPGPTTFRPPTAEDGARVWSLVRDTGVLEVNSAYCYMVMFAHHGDACLLAEQGDELAGFILGYRLPSHPETHFVWQIGVAPEQQGQGLGSRLLLELLASPGCDGVCFLEASVAASNVPSRRLFEGLSRRLDAECRVVPFLTHDLFPEPHESETLLRIGPIAPARLANDPRRSR